MMASTSKASKRPSRGRGQPARQWFSRRNAVLSWWLALLGLAGMILYPVSSGATRGAGAVLAAILTVGLLVLWWRYRVLRWALLVVCLSAGVFVVLPGRIRDSDRLALRLETVRALERYRGVRYRLGGENFLGIDCSGLVRRGAIDAMALYGIRTANPLIVRKAFALWWHGISVEALGKGASGLAEKLFTVKGIAGMDDSKLHPGDFAVSESGMHALAYLGNHQWIEADPSDGEVTEVSAKGGGLNPWFYHGVVILRWRHLELEKSVGTRN